MQDGPESLVDMIPGMKAVVMAGGQGSRLRPLTSNQPKPMLPIVGKPMMQHIIRLASRHGITELVATVHFLASVVRNFFGDGSDLGVSLSYVTEQEPLGTAGSVKNAGPLLDDRTLVLSGDSVTDVDLSELIRFHESRRAAVTVTLKRVRDPLEFGIVIVNEEGRVDRFLEKPGWGDVFSDTINTGIYVLEDEVLELIPEGKEFDFSKDLFPLLLDKGYPIYGYVTDRYWTDVGTLGAYMEAHRAVLDRDVDVEIEGFEVKPGVWLGEGAELDPDVDVAGPVYVGENARVEAGVTLREHTVLGRGASVRSGAFLHRCVVHDYVYVGPSTSLRGCVVGKNSDVKYGAKLEEGVVVADECHIGGGAELVRRAGHQRADQRGHHAGDVAPPRPGLRQPPAQELGRGGVEGSHPQRPDPEALDGRRDERRGSGLPRRRARPGRGGEVLRSIGQGQGGLLGSDLPLRYSLGRHPVLRRRRYRHRPGRPAEARASLLPG